MNYTSVDSGNQTVITAGNPIRLVPTSLPANRVDIQAKLTNTGVIYLGGPSVSASSPKGIALQAGDSYEIEKMTDLLNIFIDATISGEGVTFNWWIGEIN